MAIEWNHNIDAALGQSKAEKRPALLDFSAAPA